MDWKKVSWSILYLDAQEGNDDAIKELNARLDEIKAIANPKHLRSNNIVITIPLEWGIVVESFKDTGSLEGPIAECIHLDAKLGIIKVVAFRDGSFSEVVYDPKTDRNAFTPMYKAMCGLISDEN